MNDYSWNLNSNDFISHGNAHYSKNWDKAKQDEYNKWYYQHHKEKFAERDKYRKQAKNYSDYADKLQAESDLDTQTAKRYNRASRNYAIEGDKKNVIAPFKPNDKKLINSINASYNNSKKAKATSESYKQSAHTKQVRADATRKMADSRSQKAYQIDQEIENDKGSFGSLAKFQLYRMNKASQKTIDHGKYVVKKYLREKGVIR